MGIHFQTVVVAAVAVVDLKLPIKYSEVGTFARYYRFRPAHGVFYDHYKQRMCFTTCSPRRKDRFFDVQNNFAISMS